MARRLAGFPGSPQRYPWREWTDGSVWEIRRGEDFGVATESMRVNLHMRAEAVSRKVRTRKVTDDRGEALIFQFLESDEEEAVRTAMAEDHDRAKAWMDALYADAVEIYERARHEVTI